MNEALRELFPSLNKFTAYLNTASIGLMPLSSVRSLSNIVSDILEFNGPVNSVDYMDDLVLNPVLNEISKLIHASKDEVTISVQTTDALKRVLYAIKPERNKDNIVSVDMEFPTISCLLKSYSRSHELKLRIAKNIDGRYPIEALEQKIDDRTFAVVVSSVQWVTGYMIDIKE
ncbi:MAG: aminotransferase class V-fold PLP-dependent enzyme, partial [Euryarchaeota archaeon]|nr:aminotransferase class V-fold PLP-dependent enzyme [Euryarchaeota archaeon]